jgi:1-acylglycerone phosphate reductase
MHQRDIPKADLRTALRFYFLVQKLYKAAVWFNKISVIVLYLRIFVRRGFIISACALMGVISTFSISSMAATIWQCVPIAGGWDK